MLTRRLLICLLAGVLSANSLHAQSVNLTEGRLADRCVRNELTMELDGKIQVKQDGKDLSYPHKAKATHATKGRYIFRDI